MGVTESKWKHDCEHIIGCMVGWSDGILPIKRFESLIVDLHSISLHLKKQADCKDAPL